MVRRLSFGTINHHVDLFYNNGIIVEHRHLIKVSRQQRLWCYTHRNFEEVFCEKNNISGLKALLKKVVNTGTIN